MRPSPRVAGTAALAAIALLVPLAGPAGAQVPGLPDLLPGTGTGPPPPTLPPAVPAPVDDLVTGSEGNAANGNATATTLRGPLGVAWRVSTASRVDGILAVPGTLLTVEVGAVVARDPASGVPRWTGPSASRAAIVGTTVVTQSGARLRGLDLATGAERWSQSRAASTELVPAGDLVIAHDRGGPSFFEAYDAATGALRWELRTDGLGMPAVVGDRVYAPLCGGGFIVLDRATGRRVGGASGSCGSGSGIARAVGGTVQFGTSAVLTAGLTPSPVVLWSAARDDLALQLDDDGRVLRARDPSTGAPRWSVRPPIGTGRPFIAGGTVLNVTTRGVELRDGATGRTTFAGRFRRPSTEGGVAVATGGAAFVAVGRTLLGLAPGADGEPPRVTSATRAGLVVEFGEAATISGAARDRTLLVPRAVSLASQNVLQRRPSTRVVDTTSVTRDGTFSFRVRPSRYTVYRVTVAGATGRKDVGVTVIHRERSRIRRGGADRNTITLTVRIQVPRDVPLAGRTYALYVGRPGSRTYRRVAATRIRRTARGRGVATIRFRALDLGRRDFTRSCIGGVSRRGLNYDDRLDRGCGRASVRFG